MEPHVVYSLVSHLPLAGVDALSLVSKSIRSSIESNIGLGLLKSNVGDFDTTNVSALFTSQHKARELVKAIRRDDVESVLFILSYRRTLYHLWGPVIEWDEDNDATAVGATNDATAVGATNEEEYERMYETLPSGLIPDILQVAALSGSSSVFAAVCPMMVPEIDRINDVRQCRWENITNYMNGVTLSVLETCDPSMYEAFFTALSRTEDGLEAVEDDIGLDNTWMICCPSYIRADVTGDTRAYEVVKKFEFLPVNGDPEPHSAMLGYFKTIECIDWLISHGWDKNTVAHELGCQPYLAKYALGEASYEDTLLAIAEAKKEFFADCTYRIAGHNEL